MTDKYNLKYFIPKTRKEAIEAIHRYYDGFTPDDPTPEILICLSRLDVFLGPSKGGNSWVVAGGGFHKPLIDVDKDGGFYERIEELSFGIIVKNKNLPDHGKVRAPKDGYQTKMRSSHLDPDER